MKIEQFVMAYGVEQDRLRSILPENFISLRPVLRINAEIKDGNTGYLEFNTAVERNNNGCINRGWLNIDYWDNVPFLRQGRKVTFKTDFLTISFTPVGVAGRCPAEKDNDGCFFINSDEEISLRPPEIIKNSKEFCDCEFQWNYTPDDAGGRSTGKTLPAIPTAEKTVYPKVEFTAQNAAHIPCEAVLGTYVVEFDRQAK